VKTRAKVKLVLNRKVKTKAKVAFSMIINDLNTKKDSLK
jgi:hypothetical protein